jgi:S1-C subfamily serine protease
MRSLVVVVACLAFPFVAAAQPVDLDDISAVGFDEQTEEPLGLVVKADHPKLGFQKGDLVRTINGEPVLQEMHVVYALASGPSVLHVELVRAGKPVSLKLVPRPRSAEAPLGREQLKSVIERLRGPHVDHRLRLVTKQRQPAGVVVLDRFFLPGPTVGDIIRKIDGKPVKTVENVPAFLEASAAKPKLVIDLERAGVAFTQTLVLENSPPTATIDPETQKLIDTIEKVSDTSYKIPRKLVDAILANPMAFMKGARVVPAMKDGKPDGIKLYAIRPTSIFAKLGLANGDTLQKVNGMSLDSAEKGLEIYSKLRETKKLTVELVRRGKPVTLEWTVK